MAKLQGQKTDQWLPEAGVGVAIIHKQVWEFGKEMLYILIVVVLTKLREPYTKMSEFYTKMTESQHK